MAMLMRNDISPASGHVSVTKSPVPYLLGGVGAMLLLIAFALIILACSYLRDSATEGQEHNRSSEHHNVELVRGGKNEMGVVMSNDSEGSEDMRVIVIMAGDENPTFIAKPTSVTAGLN